MPKFDDAELPGGPIYPAGLANLANWRRAPGPDTDGNFLDSSAGAVSPTCAAYDPQLSSWYVGCGEGVEDASCNASAFEDRQFLSDSIGLTGTADIVGIAVSPDTVSYKIMVTTAGDFVRRTGTGSWDASAALTGTPTNAYNVVYSPSLPGFVAVGLASGGSEPYVATSSATGAAWTDRSANAVGINTGTGWGPVAVNGAVLVAAGKGNHTKLAVSSDGGVNWAASTTTLTSGEYTVVYNSILGKFFAINTGTLTTISVYSSTDGDVWDLVGSALPVPLDYVGCRDNHSEGLNALASYGSALVLGGEYGAANRIAVSQDGGLTWGTSFSMYAGACRGVICDNGSSSMLVLRAAGGAMICPAPMLG